ncbi:hypothetical protein ASG60_03375 [Methylobacterium sp. Leaf469]|uniref:GspMb/PilO family protein n=1 Tax=Methylobacterium sp. Leaf469 TaxID=1736387 RepID=UPI0006F4A7F3|nr:GspMb/PilO family protein [Methylobacterium sp. Leaf469]KQU05706.1 hypothetical protein ASG60_03375 [Methylobacterium sp. Leaf469]
MIAALSDRVSGWMPRAPVLLALGALAVLGLAVAGPVSEIRELGNGIAEARDRLARTRAAAARPVPSTPFSGVDADAVSAAFRARIETAIAGRAVILEDVTVVPDPDQVRLPLLNAALRGTAEGLHGVLAELDGGLPRVRTETAEIAVASPADADEERPTLLRLSLTVRGLLAPADAPPRPETGR